MKKNIQTKFKTWYVELDGVPLSKTLITGLTDEHALGTFIVEYAIYPTAPSGHQFSYNSKYPSALPVKELKLLHKENGKGWWLVTYNHGGLIRFFLTDNE